MDHLSSILLRKRAEVARRRSHGAWLRRLSDALPVDPERRMRACSALRRRPGEPLRVIAEVKFSSPSAGVIRQRSAGEVRRVARAYQAAGAAAVSVLADGPGFGGCLLDVRRAAGALGVPVLLKEFVLHRIQVEGARLAGASMVLLLVCALTDMELRDLVAEVRAAGMEPVVEAADEAEIGRALATEATIIGVNARDLRTFAVDVDRALRLCATIPGPDRIAVLMSGMADGDDLRRAASGRADAVLVGEALMRAPVPAVALSRLMEAV